MTIEETLKLREEIALKIKQVESRLYELEIDIFSESCPVELVETYRNLVLTLMDLVQLDKDTSAILN